MTHLTTSSSLISVIIPVHNAEHSLACCIHSLLAQTYSNLQVILVDDHSTDRSLEVMHQTIAGDKRFSIHATLNQAGASTARNIGLEHAVGKYVFFLDADDWLENTALSDLIDTAESGDLDLTCSSHIQDFDHGAKLKPDGSPDHDVIFSDTDLLNYIDGYLQKPYFYTLLVHCWGKLFRREIIEHTDLRFEQSLSQLEDVHFNFRYLTECNKVGYKNANLYHHRISALANSMSTRAGDENNAVEKILDAFAPIRTFLSIRDKENRINADKQIAHLFINTIIITIIRLCKKLIRQPSLKTYQNLKTIVSAEAVKTRLANYQPAPEESKMIYRALRTGYTPLITFAGVIRACKLALKK